LAEVFIRVEGVCGKDRRNFETHLPERWEPHSFRNQKTHTHTHTFVFQSKHK